MPRISKSNSVTVTESDITDLDKYSQSEVDDLVDAKSDEITISDKSSAYSVTNTDVDKQIRVTGTTTITIPESLTWETNEGCEIVNVGSDTVTIALSGSVSVNGATDDITLDPYKGVVLMALSSNTYLGTGI